MNFNLSFWGTLHSVLVILPVLILEVFQTETVEEPEEEPATTETKEEEEDGKVEEEKKMKKVEKTTWDWEKVNNVKPIWMRKSGDVEPEEYDEFYKSITKVLRLLLVQEIH